MKNKLLAMLCIGLLPFSMAFANTQDNDGEQFNSQDSSSQEALDVHSEDAADDSAINSTDDSSVSVDAGETDEGVGNYVESTDDASTTPEENEDVDPNADNDTE